MAVVSAPVPALGFPHRLTRIVVTYALDTDPFKTRAPSCPEGP